jgi:erythromycin esterase-like protein
MWRNTVVRDFADWLGDRNGRVEARRQAGFYGLDLYSLHRSMQDVITYLEQVDPEAAARACQRYSCFDHASADDGQAYGFAAAFGAGQSCEQDAVEQLIETMPDNPESWCGRIILTSAMPGQPRSTLTAKPHWAHWRGISTPARRA